MNNLDLSHLKLKTFSEQDALDYCLLNNVNPDNIKELYLFNNELTDISGIKLFKNTEYLDIKNNQLTDISVLKDLNKLEILILNNNKLTDVSVIEYLNKLRYLDVNKLRLESNQIQYIKSLKNLNILYCVEGFKNISVLKQLNRNIEIIK